MKDLKRRKANTRGHGRFANSLAKTEDQRYAHTVIDRLVAGIQARLDHEAQHGTCRSLSAGEIAAIAAKRGLDVVPVKKVASLVVAPDSNRV